MQKRNSSSTKDLNNEELKKNEGNHNSSQISLLKLKRPPLSNFTLMRSQSNLSLIKRENSSKEVRQNQDPNLSTKLSSTKSPDLSYKLSNLCDSSTNKAIKDKGYSLFDKGKENIPRNASSGSLFK